jgi:hypothetical protein
MPQHLPYRHVLADVIPVMIDLPQQQRADVVNSWLSIDHEGLLQPFCCQYVQIHIALYSDLPPRAKHLAQARRAGRTPVTKILLQLRPGRPILHPRQPIALLLASQMTHIPADAVHRQNPCCSIFITQVSQSSQEFASGESQLHDKRMRHGCRLPLSHLHVVTRIIARVDLSRASDLLIGIVDQFHPLRQPAHRARNGE